MKFRFVFDLPTDNLEKSLADFKFNPFKHSNAQNSYGCFDVYSPELLNWSTGIIVHNSDLYIDFLSINVYRFFKLTVTAISTRKE